MSDCVLDFLRKVPKNHSDETKEKLQTISVRGLEQGLRYDGIDIPRSQINQARQRLGRLIGENSAALEHYDEYYINNLIRLNPDYITHPEDFILDIAPRHYETEWYEQGEKVATVH